MKTPMLAGRLIALITVLLPITVCRAADYEIVFSTYLGGSGPEDTARAVAVDVSTYLGGTGEDLFRACAVGVHGEVVLVGSTTSTNWPTTNAPQPAVAGGPDEVMVVKLRAASPKPKP